MKHCEEADGLMAPDKDTDGFVFNHLMLRIKDPKKTLNFYSKLMGMRLIKKFDFPTMKFSLYFLGNLTDEEIAKLLTEKNIVALWQGQSENGPRALGNRSILADPRDGYIKNTINNTIKFREDLIFDKNYLK